MAVLMSRGYHVLCNDGWTVAILKALGLQVLSGLLLLAIVAPMMYWDKTSRERAVARGLPGKQTVVGKIGSSLTPWSRSGMIIQALITYGLYRYFSSDCNQ